MRKIEARVKMKEVIAMARAIDEFIAGKEPDLITGAAGCIYAAAAAVHRSEQVGMTEGAFVDMAKALYATAGRADAKARAAIAMTEAGNDIALN